MSSPLLLDLYSPWEFYRTTGFVTLASGAALMGGGADLTTLRAVLRFATVTDDAEDALVEAGAVRVKDGTLAAPDGQGTARIVLDHGLGGPGLDTAAINAETIKHWKLARQLFYVLDHAGFGGRITRTEFGLYSRPDVFFAVTLEEGEQLPEETIRRITDTFRAESVTRTAADGGSFYWIVDDCSLKVHVSTLPATDGQQVCQPERGKE